MEKEGQYRVSGKPIRYLKNRTVMGMIVASLFFVLMLSVIIFGLHNTSESIQVHGQRAAQEAILQAAVSCYALEGSYPESYEYLKEHYGIAVNEELYIVQYHIFASNIMPEITVIKR
ncbi:MAG: hypothetical protein K0S60_763 [Evtepia sp.]|jgi:competence protein ComGC|nr:hypothetical protein [Evtepia sp.]